MGNSVSNAKDLLIKGVLNNSCVDVNYALKQMTSNEVNAITINGVPILIVAIEHYADYKKTDIIKSVLKHTPSTVSITDFIGRTPLHHTIELYNQDINDAYSNICTTLFKYGTPDCINQEYNYGTALWYSVKYNVDTVTLLLRNGANVNYTYKGQSVLQHAIGNDSDNTIIDTLLVYGSNPHYTNSGHSTLQVAVIKDNVHAIKALIDNGADINFIDTVNGQPLIMTALTKSNECITLLINAGVNVNAVDTIALQSVLMRAVVMCKDISIIKALIDAGADVNYICPLNGYSVLMYACTKHSKHSNDTACIITLINAGANCYDKYRDGTTVMDRISSL